MFQRGDKVSDFFDHKMLKKMGEMSAKERSECPACRIADLILDSIIRVSEAFDPIKNKLESYPARMVRGKGIRYFKDDKEFTFQEMMLDISGE